jgi:hypothetical protein
VIFKTNSVTRYYINVNNILYFDLENKPSPKKIYFRMGEERTLQVDYRTTEELESDVKFICEKLNYQGGC